MPKEPPRKLFYKIGSVCEITGTQPYILRFWESEFPQLAPQKSRSGQRLFRERDVEMVRQIKRLLYEEGYTIAGARRRLEQEEAERGTPSAGAQQVAALPAPETLASRRSLLPDSSPAAGRASPVEDLRRRLKEMRGTLKEVRRELQSLLRRLEMR